MPTATQVFRWRPKPALSVPLITACFCICEVLRGIDAGVLAVILPSIAEDLHANSIDTYWTGSSYILSMTITQPIFAGISKSFGQRSCLLASVGVFIIASALCALATNIKWLIGTRLLQGVGAGGMDVSFSMIIVNLVSLKDRPKYNMYMQMALTLGIASGAIVGAVVVEHFSWRVIFWVNVPIATLALILLFVLLHLKRAQLSFRDQVKSMDWLGILLISVSLVGVLYALLSGGVVFPWKSPRIITPMILGGLSFGAFIFYESAVAGRHFGPEPLIPMRIFSPRTATVGYSVVILHAVVWCSLAFNLPLYFYVVEGRSQLGMAVRMLPTGLVPVLFAVLTTVLMTRLGKYKVLNTLGVALLTGGMLAMWRLSEKSRPGQTIGYQLIPAIGVGILFPTRTMMIQAAQKRDDDVPIASSVVAMLLNVGQCFGQALGSAIWQNSWNGLLSQAIASESILQSFSIPAADVEHSFDKIRTLPPLLRDQYRHIAATSISRIWIFMFGFGVTIFIVSFFAKDLSFDRDTKTTFDDGEDLNEDDSKKSLLTSVAPIRMSTIPLIVPEGIVVQESTGYEDLQQDHLYSGRYYRSRSLSRD